MRDGYGRLTLRRALWVFVAAAALGATIGLLAVWSPWDRKPAAEGTVIWAVGDGPDGGDDTKRVARFIVDQRPDRFIYLGDVYDEPDEEGEQEALGVEPDERPWLSHYDEAYGSLERVTYPTPGNHDWPARAQEDYVAYWSRVKGRAQPSWYAFRLQGWQFISLNSEEDMGPGSAQHDWLRSQLQGPGDCRIGFWHRPRYSGGSHGDEEDVDPAWDLLEGRASLILNGHEHNMQRLEPIDGMTQLISGAGGRSHYPVDEQDDRLAFSNDSDDGALRLELLPGVARFSFVKVDGTVLNSGEVRCRRS